MSIKHILKPLTPPIFLTLYRKLTTKNVSYNGNFKTWQDAVNKSAGWDKAAIFEKVSASAKLVKEGKAAYERDSVIFDKIQYAWPLLACLEHIALADNHLSLIDFGGSLGTTYFQNRHFLKPIASLKWHVVEQPHYVECGKHEFEDEHLKFEYTIEDVIKNESINCLLTSGAMQYFEHPVEWFEKFKNHHFKYLLFDRISFIADDERISVQTVPSHIYSASLPCWFFNEAEFINHFKSKYNLIADFDSADETTLSSDNKKLYWKGFFFKLKK